MVDLVIFKKMIWMIVLVSCFFAGLHTQEIGSIGQFANEDFTWATGIPSLQFGSSFNCSGISACQMTWFWGLIRVANSDFSSSRCIKIESFAEISCSISEGVLYSNLTLSNQFNLTGTTTLSVTMSGDVSSTNAKSVDIQNCDQSSIGIGSGYILDGATGDYLGVTTVVCTHGDNSSATCQYDATWLQNDQCQAETTTVTVDPTTSTTKSDPETTTESPPTELPTTEPLITEGSPTNCTEEEICCECIVGIVIIIISAPPSGVFVVFIVFILYRGDFDFLKRDFKLCTGEFIGTSLAIVCAAILLSRCKCSEHWTGGDIACVVLGLIGAPVDVIFCIILIRKWFQKDYSRGTSS